MSAERAIDKEVVVNATLDQAWDAWTTRDGIVKLLRARCSGRAARGRRLPHPQTTGGAPGMKGADDMRFMALQPKKMLSFDWNAPPHLAEARTQRTFVVVNYAAVDDKTTRVTLHHTGWGEGGQWDQAYLYSTGPGAMCSPT